MANEENSWEKSILVLNSTIRDAAENLSCSSLRIVLVVDDQKRLVGTVSDGDIRRGMLRGLTLDSGLAGVINRNPFVAPKGVSRRLIRQLMESNKIQQIPEVDEERRVLYLHSWENFVTSKILSNKIVIMAGGKGSRLLPYTENCPKPMLLIGDKPMLQHIIERARDEGFRNFVLTVNYLADRIKDHFGDGSQFDVNIEYVKESLPLGTAGSLSMLGNQIKEPFLVTNCDVITEISYSDLLDFHCRQGSIATMAVKLHEWQNPFGIVHFEGLNIVRFEEKPVFRSHVNAGIYALSPEALLELRNDEPCDMPTLFNRLKSKAYKIIVYPIHELWLDVGQHKDLIAANKNYAD